MRASLNVCLLLICGCIPSETAKILLSGGFGDGSHFLSLVPLGKTLASRGHDVKYMVADAYLEPAAKLANSSLINFEVFHLPGLKEKVDDSHARLCDIAFADSKLSEMMRLLHLLSAINHEACEAVIIDEELLTRLSEYDGFVVDVVWVCGVYIKSYLERHRGTKDVPVLVLAPMTPIPYIFKEAGSPFVPSYQPVSLLKTMHSSSMSFIERCRNVFAYLSFVFMFDKMVFHDPFADLVSRYDLHNDLTSTISNHVDLYFINSDFSVEFPFALMPNIIPVGGLTTRPANSLDNDLEEFMMSSGQYGVIIFSLGSYFAKITSTRPKFINMFLEAFSRLPQKIIFQLKELPPRELPDNIMALPWLPLNDLLGHPKTRVLLYHGGNNAFYEALYHGVPLVVVPLGGDQHDVGVRVLSSGLGTQIDMDRLSPDHIIEQLEEVLFNPAYQATARRLSAIFRDRPMSPAETAAFWVEHVIKHGGDHLRPRTQSMSFFQIYMIDIMCVAISCSVLLCCGIRSCFSYSCRLAKIKAKQE
ncbi:UDP-glucuronosyltransferase 2B1-like [Diadema setosum]|uniref:UDP-glucuronosyltransferase 2B1-like n=1 Tax=Diadema setosum TaxID=31175 RepID=UPI003B3A8733